MKLGYFTMPIHRIGRDYRTTLAEDREAVQLAERLGFVEAFIGEHVTDVCESITSSLMFLASLAYGTTRIKLGSATVNLPNAHPATVAAEVAMLDTMLEGRFLFGIGPGGLPSDAEMFGNMDADRIAMFVEAIDHILALWRDPPPYLREGRFWKLGTPKTYLPDLGMGEMLKPFQQPHPPILVTVIAPYSKGLVAAAERGWQPISANFMQPCWVKTHWPMYEKGCKNSGCSADPRQWRIAKSIFVAEDEATARRYAKSPDGPYGYHYANLARKSALSRGLNVFKTDPQMPDEQVTTQYILDGLVIAGTPESVVDQLLAFRETTGPFGTLLYVGHDWIDPELSRRSMELMAEQVMPAVNRALGEGG